MGKLTETQWRVLGYIVDGERFNIPFRSAEVLRKRGLVERESIFIAKRVYADETGEHVQFDVPLDALVIWHDWFPCPAGRRALAEYRGGE